MREINLENYHFFVTKPDGTREDKIYNVKDALAAVLFLPGQGLRVSETLAREAVAKRIEEAGNSILLEDSEWERLRLAFESVKDISRNDIECVKRVLDAPKVEVEKRGKPTKIGN